MDLFPISTLFTEEVPLAMQPHTTVLQSVRTVLETCVWAEAFRAERITRKWLHLITFVFFNNQSISFDQKGVVLLPIVLCLGRGSGSRICLRQASLMSGISRSFLETDGIDFAFVPPCLSLTKY